MAQERIKLEIESPSLIGRTYFDNRHCRPENIQPSIRVSSIPDGCRGIALVGREFLNNDCRVLWAFGWLPPCVSYIPEGTIERLFGQWGAIGLDKYIGPIERYSGERSLGYRYEIIGYGARSPDFPPFEEISAFDGYSSLCSSNSIGVWDE